MLVLYCKYNECKLKVILNYTSCHGFAMRKYLKNVSLEPAVKLVF